AHRRARPLLEPLLLLELLKQLLRLLRRHVLEAAVLELNRDVLRLLNVARLLVPVLLALPVRLRGNVLLYRLRGRRRPPVRPLEILVTPRLLLDTVEMLRLRLLRITEVLLADLAQRIAHVGAFA